jgi:FF domain
LVGEKLLDSSLSVVDMKWRDFVRIVREDPRYVNLVGQPGSTPREIYEDALNEERDLLKLHKAPFK